MPTTLKAFRSQRTVAQCIVVSRRPFIYTTVQLLAPGNGKAESKQPKSSNKLMDHIKETSDIDLKFIMLDVDSARVVALTDASFANAPGMKSKFGFVVVMVEDWNQVNKVHYE